jgi:hypothetical protein
MRTGPGPDAINVGQHRGALSNIDVLVDTLSKV